MTRDELDTRMAENRVAGAVIIPSTFDASIQTLLPEYVGAVERPTIAIRANAGGGGISNGLLSGSVTPILAAVNTALGQSLLEDVESTGASVAGPQAYLLSQPFEVASSAYTPLPENSGLGTSAFYYALIIVLLGFVGASLVNPFVDSVLGFAPSELGPLVARRSYVAISRRQTLLVKFGIMISAAPLAALAVELVAGLFVGIPISDPVQLWALSSAAIAAIGVSGLTVFSIFGGGIGSLANTIFFIALAMTASGGTVPLSALPPFFSFIADFEPFRPVVDGVRAILYFDAVPEAGLTSAWTHVVVGGIAGIVLGLAVTTLYAKNRMFTRHPRPVPVPVAGVDLPAA
jgi:uncharacterized phage infection (PIP) family protein YhgE